MATTQELITQLYVGYYNRAPDPEGLEYWIGRVNAGVSQADIANSFATSPEAIAIYPYFAFPDLNSPKAFLESVYLNLFNRTIDDDGLAYYTEKLTSGATPVGEILAEIIGNAATNTGSDDQAVLANKVTVGLNWAQTAAAKPGFTYDEAAKGSANTILDGVTKDPATVTAAEKATSDFFDNIDPDQGKTYILTVNTDHFVGTAGNDTFIAGQVNGAATLSLGDSIDGGAGIDTIDLYGNNNLTPFATANVKNVEIVNAFVSASGAALNVAQNSGVKEVWVKNADVSNNVAGTVDVTLNKAQLAGIAGTTVAAAVGGSTAIAFNFNDVSGSANAATLALDSAVLSSKKGDATAKPVIADGTASVTIAGIQKLTVDADGKNSIGTLNVADATEIVVEGEGSLKATVGSATALKSVDATANKGGVDLTLAQSLFGAGKDVKVTTGAGDDKIVFTDALDGKATIDLGEGKNTLTIKQGNTAIVAGSSFKAGAGAADTLVLDTTTVINATNGKLFTGFENIVLKGASSYKVGDIAGITGYEIASGAATDASLTNLAEATTVKISATSTGTQTLTLKDNSLATSSVSVVLDNGAKEADDGVETIVDTNAHVLNVVSKGLVASGKANEVDLTGATASLAQITNIVVTGDQAAKITTAAAAALTLIDGNAATGKLNLDATGALKAIQFKGGSADDTIKASDVADAVSKIIGGKGADTITLGATAANNKGDVVLLTAQADSTATAFDKITNFAGGTTTPANADKLDLSVFGFEGAQANLFTLAAGKVTVTGTNTADANFSITDASAKDFFLDAGNNVGVALASNANETFVFIDADKDGSWNAATDSVVKLAGNYTVDLLTAADNFLFA